MLKLKKKGAVLLSYEIHLKLKKKVSQTVENKEGYWNNLHKL